MRKSWSLAKEPIQKIEYVGTIGEIKERLSALVFSGQGEYLAAGTVNYVYMYCPEGRELKWRLGGAGRGEAQHIVFVTGDHVVIGWQCGIIEEYDSGNLIHTEQMDTIGIVECIAVCPSLHIAAIKKYTSPIEIREYPGGKLVGKIEHQRGGAERMVFVPGRLHSETKLIVAWKEGGVSAYVLPRMVMAWYLDRTVRCMDVSSAGKLVIGGYGGEIELVDTEHGKVTKTSSPSMDYIVDLVCSPSGQPTASVDATGLIVLWDCHTLSPLGVTVESRVATKVALSPCGRYMATGGGNGRVYLYHTELSQAVPSDILHSR